MPKKHEHIKLTTLESLAVNIYAPFDSLDALGIRKFYNPNPSSFETYYQRDKANTPLEKMRSMWLAKIDKTKKLVHQLETKKSLGTKINALCNKTWCGRLQRYIAIRHYNHRNGFYK